MKMRPYQDAAIAGTFNAWEENDSALIVLPTGLGKTVVFSEIVRRMQPVRSIIVAHREELIFQAAEKIKRVTGLDGGIVFRTVYDALRVTVFAFAAAGAPGQ